MSQDTRTFDRLVAKAAAKCSCCDEPAREVTTERLVAGDTRRLCGYCSDPEHVHFGDSRVAVKVKPHVIDGKVCGAYVYLTREQLARALGVTDREIPKDIYVRRTVLDEGTGQVLLRLKKEA